MQTYMDPRHSTEHRLLFPAADTSGLSTATSRKRIQSSSARHVSTDRCLILPPLPSVDIPPNFISPSISRTQSSPYPFDNRCSTLDESYPSPPLTGAELKTTVPLPDTHLPISMDVCDAPDLDESERHTMRYHASSSTAPLSPPPTIPLGTLDLPLTEPVLSSTNATHPPGFWLPFGGCDEGVALSSKTSKWRSNKTNRKHSSHHTHNTRNSELTLVYAKSDVALFQRDPLVDEMIPPQPTPVVDLPSSLHCLSLAGIDSNPPRWSSQSPVSDDMSLSPEDPGGELVSSPPFSVRKTSISWKDEDMSWCATKGEPPPPVSPRPTALSLDFHLDNFGPSSHSTEFTSSIVPSQRRSTLFPFDISDTPTVLSSLQDSGAEMSHEYSSHDNMDIDDDPPPSPRYRGVHLPPEDPSDMSFADPSDISFADTVMPQDEDESFDILPSSPSRRSFQLLPDFDTSPTDLCPTLATCLHSPHHSSTSLPDLDIDFLFPPSPLSPHATLPSLPDDLLPPAPLYFDTPTNDDRGLGLFLQPGSVDPPPIRSPSPEEDRELVDTQLGPGCSSQEKEEFERLRALRRQTLAAERAARREETELNERVSSVANALLPANWAPGLPDVGQKAGLKRELQVAMDMRAELRRTRKREKQRGREVGALLDLKTGRPQLVGTKAGVRSIPQLVANMLLRRRDTYRPLAQKKAKWLGFVQTSLSRSVSMEDLHEQLQTQAPMQE